jgi:hypothetical protein
MNIFRKDYLGLPKLGWDRYALQNRQKNNIQIRRELQELILCMILIFNHLYSQIIVRILLQKSMPTSVSVTFSQIYFLLKKVMNIYPTFLSGDPIIFVELGVFRRNSEYSSHAVISL